MEKFVPYTFATNVKDLMPDKTAKPIDLQFLTGVPVGMDLIDNENRPNCSFKKVTKDSWQLKTTTRTRIGLGGKKGLLRSASKSLKGSLLR